MCTQHLDPTPSPAPPVLAGSRLPAPVTVQGPCQLSPGSHTCLSQWGGEGKRRPLLQGTGGGHSHLLPPPTPAPGVGRGPTVPSQGACLMCTEVSQGQPWPPGLPLGLLRACVTPAGGGGGWAAPWGPGLHCTGPRTLSTGPFGRGVPKGTGSWRMGSSFLGHWPPFPCKLPLPLRGQGGQRCSQSRLVWGGIPGAPEDPRAQDFAVEAPGALNRLIGPAGPLGRVSLP